MSNKYQFKLKQTKLAGKNTKGRLVRKELSVSEIAERFKRKREGLK